MLIVFAAILAFVAFVVLMRLLWTATRLSKASTVATLAAAGLIIGLGILAATGRLPWLAAAGAAVLPFLRRGFGLIRYLPWVYQLRAKARERGTGSAGGATADNSAMAPGRAREILGLGAHPTREEVISAHRRLMQKLHPDRGGSTFLAQQLNEAKRVLLREP